MVLQWQVGEAQLVDLLEKFSQHTQKKTTIKVNNIIIHLHQLVVKFLLFFLFVQFERKRLGSDDDDF